MLRLIFRALFTIGIGVILSGIPESTADAGFLKNGARPRDGDRLRTVRPPRSGSRNRILAPGETRSRQRGASGKGARRGKQQHTWFWKDQSPALASASSSRWETVADLMAKRRSSGKGLVGAQALRTILTSYRTQIATAARRYNVSEAMILAVIVVESRGKSAAVSPKGAQGLMQLIPATAKRFGVTNSFDTQQNILGGAAYLDWLLREFRGDPLLALAGYNAGEGAVRKHKGVPPYNETRDYVVKVMDAVAAARALCATPPSSPRAACNWVASTGQSS